MTCNFSGKEFHHQSLKVVAYLLPGGSIIVSLPPHRAASRFIILDEAAFVCLIHDSTHNYPLGNLKPSEGDYSITKKIIEGE